MKQFKKNMFEPFEKFQISSESLSLLSGGYLVSGGVDNSGRTATASGDSCDGTAVCNCVCKFHVNSTTSAIIETVFNEENVGGLSSDTKLAMYNNCIDSCENDAERDYLASILL